MTPIERAARALCRLDGHPEMATMDGKPLWQDYLPEVLAVLEALHEPSQQMAEAGVEIVRVVSPDEDTSAYQLDAANIWRMMIDAIRMDVVVTNE